MTDSDGIANAEVVCHRDHIVRKVTPGNGRRGFGTAAVTAEFNRQRPPAGEEVDDVVPAAAVKTGGVSEQQGRVRARPLPRGQFHIASTQEMQVHGLAPRADRRTYTQGKPSRRSTTYPRACETRM